MVFNYLDGTSKEVTVKPILMRLKRSGIYKMQQLNLERLLCPMPVIKTQNALRRGAIKSSLY